jgi:uncharacterized protein YidB (DUF937 family)
MREEHRRRVLIRCYAFRKSSGSLAIFAAIRRASSEKHDLDQRRGRVCPSILERGGRGIKSFGEEAMAGLNDVIRAAFPDGNVANSLTNALGALLGSNVLTGGGAGQTASTGSQPTTDAGGVLGGLGGLLNKLEQGGLGDQTKSWVGTGQNQPVSPGQLGSALGPNIIKTLSQMTGVSEDQLTKQLSQGIPVIVNWMTPNGKLPTVAELSKMIGQS